ncbi:MAG: hypothetical protein ACSHXA_07655 [Polaribacter sp.]|uniref:hypothetical protein n=1 Tax=Polaribacter sp. TaxID=1920175 RepID=UPI003EF4C90A
MHKIIFDTFEFDLSPYDISTVEDNHWFSDEFFTKYSFPFNFKLTDELLVVFGDLLDDNAKFIKTEYNVKYVLGNQMESCVFEIESQIGLEITSTYRYGFDEFPNFNKELTELPLEESEVVNIYEHAKTIIPQTWPAVNYNYPQIHTEKYDIDTATWVSFSKKLNNYVIVDEVGFFPENTETVESGYINKNIIQPLPYLLHVLTVGFLDAGYVLQGDILSHSLFKKMLLFKDDDYFEDLGDIEDFNVFYADHTSQHLNGYYIYDITTTLLPSTTYTIKGFFNTYSKPTPEGEDPYERSAVGLYLNNAYVTGFVNTTSEQATFDVDATFTTNDNAYQELRLYATCSDIAFPSPIDPYKLVVSELAIERDLSSIAREIKIYNDVNLKRAVPTCTFGKLTTEIINLFNLEILIKGKKVFLNFIELKTNYKDAFNLSNFEELEPKRTFNSLDSLYLSYSKPSNEEVEFTPVFVNKEGVFYNEEKVNDDTEKIEIDILPLIQANRYLTNTAVNFDEGGDNKIYLCLYDGLQNQLNTTISPTELELPVIHNKYHYKWFIFRLTSINYQWVFKMYLEELSAIKKKVFAYGRYFVVRSLVKSQIGDDLFEIDIESETLP